MTPPAPDETTALEALATRLQGFGSSIHAEWLDGALTAVAAGPYQPEPAAEWVPALLGEEFERAFADPADVAQALATVLQRLQSLRRMLDGEALLDNPDALRLEPMLYSWDDAADKLPAEPDDDARALMQGGALWAEGFLSAVSVFPEIWVAPSDTEPRELLGELLGDIEALLKPTPDDAPVPPVAEGEEPISPREAAIDRALFAAQDLRLFWLDHAPKPATRRVEAQPGRNDPCSCGSGKKFKKCHGAVA